MALPIILTSASPRRRELLERIGIEIEVMAAEYAVRNITDADIDNLFND